MIELPETEGAAAMAVRLLVKLARIGNAPQFTSEHLLEIAHLLAARMSRDKMLELLEKLDELEVDA